MFDFSKGQLTNKEQSPNLGGFSFDSGIPDVAKRQEPITATGEALKLIGNMPSSVYSFGKGILSFLNPIKTAETVGQIIPETKGLIQEAGGVKEAGKEFIKGFPKTTYEVLVPSAARDLISAGYHFLTGDNSYSGVDVPLLRAEKAIVEDPVGQIAPFLIAAKYGANKAGYGKQFDTLIEKSASPIVKPISYVASKTGELAGKVASQTLGAITGAGPEAIKTAFKGGEEFKSALRGGVSESQLAQNAENAVNAVKNLRRDTYQNQLVEISKNPVSYDISPLHTELSTNLSKFKVVETGNSAKPLDFSRSTLLNDLEGQKTVTAIYRTMSDWGTKMGDRTAIGLDTLKRSFDNLIKPSKDSYAFSTAMKNSVKNILNKNVPGYEEMTSGYSKMSNLLDDIRGATGAGGKASSDTIVSKLTQAVRADKQFRIEMLKTMEGLSGQQLLDQIAGISLNSYIPRGLIGRGLDIYSIASIARGFISPAVFMELVLTSPRIVGEFVRALGLSNKVVSQILSDINNFRINPTVAQFLAREKDIKLGLGIGGITNQNKNTELQKQVNFQTNFKSENPITPDEVFKIGTQELNQGIKNRNEIITKSPNPLTLGQLKLKARDFLGGFIPWIDKPVDIAMRNDAYNAYSVSDAFKKVSNEKPIRDDFPISDIIPQLIFNVKEYGGLNKPKEIVITDPKSEIIFHEMLHNWADKAGLRTPWRDFDVNWEASKKIEPLLVSIDKHLNNSEIYKKKNEMSEEQFKDFITSERFAYLGGLMGTGGLEVLPPRLKIYYEQILTK